MTVFFIAAGTVLFLILLALFLWLSNNSIHTSNIELTDESFPGDFSDFTVVHLSDLHNKRFGRYQRRLLKKVRAASPDLIAITGDLVHGQPCKNAMDLIRNLTPLAPTYFVPGNHERRSGTYEGFSEQLEECGVILLGNRTAPAAGTKALCLAGLNDPSFLPSRTYCKNVDVTREKLIADQLRSLKVECGARFPILLSHRPELLALYAEAGFPLVLSGHAHGGQFRFFRRGIYSPNQGLFPKYTSGLYRMANTRLIVSRGLGNSKFPLRLFNRPEIIRIVLKKG